MTMQNDKKTNHWPALPTGMSRPGNGCSKEGRRFTNITFENIPYMVAALLDDRGEGSMWLQLDFHDVKDGAVNIEVVPFDYRRMIEAGDDAKYIGVYVQELYRLVKAGVRKDPQYVVVSTDGWFSLETDAQVTGGFHVPGLDGHGKTIH
jgi:hypothetical protein